MQAGENQAVELTTMIDGLLDDLSTKFTTFTADVTAKCELLASSPLGSDGADARD